MVDPEEQLKKVVNDTGKVSPVYGGFEVRVSKPISFPWYRVFKLLIRIGHDIWVSEKEDKIRISSGPKAR